jgi:hypothetical protein
MEMFERASRLALRFDTSRGQLTTEDLWQLPLTHSRAPNLNDLAKSLHRELESNQVVSFVDDKKEPDERLRLAFDVVLHVIAVKKEEGKAQLAARTRAEQKRKLLAALADRESDELKGKSADELRRMIEDLS